MIAEKGSWSFCLLTIRSIVQFATRLENAVCRSLPQIMVVGTVGTLSARMLSPKEPDWDPGLPWMMNAAFYVLVASAFLKK